MRAVGGVLVHGGKPTRIPLRFIDSLDSMAFRCVRHTRGRLFQGLLRAVVIGMGRVSLRPSLTLSPQIVSRPQSIDASFRPKMLFFREICKLSCESIPWIRG